MSRLIAETKSFWKVSDKCRLRDT